MASPTDYSDLTDGACRICGEVLATTAEQAIGIHVGCSFYNLKSASVEVKGVGYGFSKKHGFK